MTTQVLSLQLFLITLFFAQFYLNISQRTQRKLVIYLLNLITFLGFISEPDDWFLAFLFVLNIILTGLYIINPSKYE